MACWRRLYLREYAKAGAVVSAIRISINNLAGVPSIVFGVFGLGLFCYVIGASIDQLFFRAALAEGHADVWHRRHHVGVAHAGAC